MNEKAITFTALVFINDDELRLCFVNAGTMQQARDIIEREYAVLQPTNSIRIELYNSVCYHNKLEEVSITYFS